MAHLLIVDDEQSICWGLSRLAENMGHTVVGAASAEQGLDAARCQRPDVIVLDVRLPGMDGLSAMQHFREIAGQAPIIIITAFGQLNTAVEAVRNGAFDYLLKPFDLDVAQRAIERALQSLTCAATMPSPSTPEPGDPWIVGHSSVMQEVFKQIAIVAPSDACVHVHGESGSGKELAARAIHHYSRRCQGPFIAVNVASLNPSLAESELFGHTKGSFTGAEQSHKGLLEQADGGTIFLDEVADIPMSLQVKLLRVLEHGEMTPVGGDRVVQSDFRLISATHQNLSQRVADGLFRHDLYYRLITFEINIPPLRNRRDDVEELVAHFLDILAAKNGQSRCVLSAAALAELRRREWFGNVRELRNAVEHAMILARGGMIAPEHLPPPMLPMTAKDAGKKIPETIDPKNREKTMVALIREWTEQQFAQPDQAANVYDRFLQLTEPPLLQTAMERCGGQYLAAARCLGMHRTTLRKKLDELSAGET
jgi:two-component system, NtrC family, nitrogen regulation response regulator GlnG